MISHGLILTRMLYFYEQRFFKLHIIRLILLSILHSLKKSFLLDFRNWAGLPVQLLYSSSILKISWKKPLPMLTLQTVKQFPAIENKQTIILRDVFCNRRELRRVILHLTRDHFASTTRRECSKSCRCVILCNEVDV